MFTDFPDGGKLHKVTGFHSSAESVWPQENKSIFAYFIYEMQRIITPCVKTPVQCPPLAKCYINVLLNYMVEVRLLVLSRKPPFNIIQAYLTLRFALFFWLHGWRFPAVFNFPSFSKGSMCFYLHCLALASTDLGLCSYWASICSTLNTQFKNCLKIVDWTHLLSVPFV